MSRRGVKSRKTSNTPPWGLILAAFMVAVAVFVGIALIWRREPEPSIAATPTVTETRDPTQTPSPGPATPAPTPMQPLTHTVQGGDTLSAIAEEHDVSLESLVAANDLVNPDVLQIGQILIIPQADSAISPGMPSPESATGGSAAETHSIMVPPTLTPSSPSEVKIMSVGGVGQLERETIVLRNQGGMVSLDGWSLSNPTGHQFIFPALTILRDGEIRVHSAQGDDTPRDLYWAQPEPVWQEGQLITLRDADGNLEDTYLVSR